MISFAAYKQIINNNEPCFVEKLAAQAREITIREFGRTISLYTPLYLANYCDSRCVYCGFQHSNTIKRLKLTIQEMELEMQQISAMGIKNILLLTGESRKQTPLPYLVQAVQIASRYFPSVALEVYPLDRDEYHQLHKNGSDGITIYQETYNRERYQILHTRGKKQDYEYRFKTPWRAASAGLRMITMGVLLGLSPVIEDTWQLFKHLAEMEQQFPGVEFSLSFPRLIPIPDSDQQYFFVDDITLVKLICLARILHPRIGINLSTRERPIFRNHALEFGITRISAASKTSVGGYLADSKADHQFEVQDHRSVQEIVNLLMDRGFDPVFTDWRRF